VLYPRLGDASDLGLIPSAMPHAVWLRRFQGHDAIRVTRAGRGITVTAFPEIDLDAVNPTGTRALSCSSEMITCQIGTLNGHELADLRTLTKAIPMHDNVGIHKWLRDGRIVFHEMGTFGIWFVDPDTGKLLEHHELAEPYDSVSDDGKWILWVTWGDDKKLLSWRKLADPRDQSREFSTSVSCDFTPETRLIYCTADSQLIVIEPTTGKQRVIATGVAETFIASPDGRSITFRSATGTRTMAVDVTTGEQFPIGPPGARPIAWLR